MTVTLVLLQLVNNPDKLMSLVSEIDDAFPSREDEITFARTQELKYLNAVVYEALRLGGHPASESFYSLSMTVD